jgi:Tfp pilus assembly protein PilO
MTGARRLWWAATVAVALLLGAGCWFLALSPMLDEAHEADAAADRTEQLNEDRRLEIARLAADRANEPALQDELASLRSHFPTALELESFVQQLADLSARSGAVVTSVSRSEPTGTDVGGGRLYRVQVNLAIDGTFDQKLQYMSDLQSVDDRLFLVTDWDNVGDDRPMTITGYTFVLVDASAVQPAETPAEEAADPDGEASP